MFVDKQTYIPADGKCVGSMNFFVGHLAFGLDNSQ